MDKTVKKNFTWDWASQLVIFFLFIIIPEDQFLLPLSLRRTNVLLYACLESLGNTAGELLFQVIAFGLGWSQSLEIHLAMHN